MTAPTPNPPAPQGEAKDHNGWICQRCTKLGRAKCVCHLESQVPSAPKAEQVPQEVRELVARIQRLVFGIRSGGAHLDLNEAEAAALIVADRERYGQEIADRYEIQLKAAQFFSQEKERERDQLRRELEQTAEKAERYRLVTLKQDVELIQLRYQLAALQREHDALLKISAAALNTHRQERP